MGFSFRIFITALVLSGAWLGALTPCRVEARAQLFSLSQYWFPSAQYNEAGRDILKAYASGCQSYGPWSSAATSQTQALEGVIRRLKESEDCSSLMGALTSAQSLTSQIQRMASDPTQAQLQEAQQTKNLLLLEYNSTNDSGIRADLAKQLAQAEMTYAQAQATTATSQQSQTNQNLVNGFTQSSSYLGNLLTSPDLSRCLMRNPALGVELLTQSLAVSGSFLSGPIGAPIAAAGQLTSELINLMSSYHFEKELSKLESSDMRLGLTCALESMAESYCAAEDQRQLVLLQAENYVNQATPSEFWTGIDLLMQRVPGLMGWLSKFSSGSSPGDTLSAERQNLVWAKVQQLQATMRMVQGVFAQTQRLAIVAPANELEKIARKLLTDVLGVMMGAPSSSQPASALSDFYSTRSSLLYAMVGQAYDCVPGSTCLDESSIPLPPNPTIPAIIGYTNAILAEVESISVRGLHRVISFDPAGHLLTATQKGSLSLLSPMELIGNVISFIDLTIAYRERRDPEVLKSVRHFIDETRAILVSVQDKIKSTESSVQAANKAAGEVFELLRLYNGVGFIQSRINRIIGWDLDTRIRYGDIPKKIDEILKVSGQTALGALTANGMSLDQVVADIENAHSVGQAAYENFAHFFAGGYSATLEYFKTAATRARERKSGESANTYLRSKLCILLAAGVTSWPKEIDPALCEGVEMKSIYPQMRETLKFSTVYGALRDGQSLSDRICLPRAFARRSYLYGTAGAWRGKSARATDAVSISVKR